MIKCILSRRLGELRWTQADLARTTGIRPATINDMYHDMSDRINLEHLDLICDALDCDVADIFIHVPDDKQLLNTRAGKARAGRKQVPDVRRYESELVALYGDKVQDIDSPIARLFQDFIALLHYFDAIGALEAGTRKGTGLDQGDTETTK